MSKVSGWFNKKLKRSSGASHAEEQASHEQSQDPNFSGEASIESPTGYEHQREEEVQAYHEREVAIDDGEIEIVREPTPEADMSQFEKKKKDKKGGMFSKFSGGVAFKKKKGSAPSIEETEPQPHHESHEEAPYYPPHGEPEPQHHVQPAIQQPAYVTPQLTVQKRGITKRQREQQEAEREEAIGMSYMKQYQDRIREQRRSVAPGYGAYYGAARAPGFDYVHWKPRGKVRYDYGGLEYDRLCHALAPYVRCVVVSGCEGVEERRWAALTESAETNSRPLQSRVASRDVL